MSLYFMNIHFTYRSSAIKPNQILKPYFQLMGIMVSETYTDMNNGQKDALDIDLSNYKGELHAINFDALVYVLSEDKDIDWFRKIYLHKQLSPKDEYKIIVICNNLDYFNSLYGDDKSIYKITYTDGLPNKDLLMEVNKAFHEKGVINDIDLEVFNSIAGVYCENKVYSLLDILNYAYPDETLAWFTNIKDKCSNAINGFEGLVKPTPNAYLSYTILNLKYKVDNFCLRCRRPLAYDSNNMWKDAKALISLESNPVLGSSFLLVGQIVDDVIMDPSEGYSYYMKACELGNVDAYFEKAMYWKNYKKYYDYAEMYLKVCLAYSPTNYRAWFNLGLTYLKQSKYEEALDAFSKLGVVLSGKFVNNRLSLSDMDYFIKSYLDMSYIYQYFSHFHNAARCCMKAESIWNEIDVNYYEMELNLDAKDGLEKEYDAIFDGMREKFKKDVQVDKVYLTLCEIATQLKDDFLYNQYQEKLNDLNKS